MKNITRLFAVAVLAAGSLSSFNILAAKHDETKVVKPAADAALAEGEIRKIDKDTSKLTIKHGEIKSLEMPPMTMVFHVKDKAMLDKVKTGDKVTFKAVNDNGKMTVTEIQSGK